MRVGVRGPREVREGDRRVDIPSARQRALVALLALDAGRVVPVERLIEGLWGDDAPEDARNALRHHVSRLRRAIGPSLVTRGPGYLLAVAPDDVDALRFASLAAEARAGLRSGGGGEVAATLRSALALWRGPRWRSPGRRRGPLRRRPLDGAARRRGRGDPDCGR